MTEVELPSDFILSSDTSNIELLRKIEPRQFEQLVWTVYRQLGWEVQETPFTQDGGVDGILSKGNKKLVLQCKRFKGNVGEPVLRDLYGTYLHQNATGAVLVTTGKVSKQAKSFVEGKNIKIINGSVFLAMLKRSAVTSEMLPDLPIDQILENFRVALEAKYREVNYREVNYRYCQLTLKFTDARNDHLNTKVLIDPQATDEEVQAIVAAIADLSDAGLTKWVLKGTDGKIKQNVTVNAVPAPILYIHSYATCGWRLVFYLNAPFRPSSTRFQVPGPKLPVLLGACRLRKTPLDVLNNRAAVFEELVKAFRAGVVNNGGSRVTDISKVYMAAPY